MSLDSHPNTPGHEASEAQPERGVRYLIRCRRARFDREQKTDTQLIQNLCKREALDEKRVIHIGTSFTESRVHIVFDYNNHTHDAVQIRAFKSKGRNEISIPPEMMSYLNRWVEQWKSMRESGMEFPIREEVYFFTHS
jgi:hypothetical protein